ncbi:MAG TPA: hypothetical protein VL475_06225, partial [Planctomycetaceae bacterium]|nr:hypothetical protein [Planctomycetaceae bacterium]
MFGIGTAEMIILLVVAVFMLGGLVGGIILIVHLIRNSGASHSPAGASLSPCPDCGRPLSPLATTCP